MLKRKGNLLPDAVSLPGVAAVGRCLRSPVLMRITKHGWFCTAPREEDKCPCSWLRNRISGSQNHTMSGSNVSQHPPESWSMGLGEHLGLLGLDLCTWENLNSCLGPDGRLLIFIP